MVCWAISHVMDQSRFDYPRIIDREYPRGDRETEREREREREREKRSRERGQRQRDKKKRKGERRR